MLIIDNYDSFTYNIVEYVRILGMEPIVIRNDELTLNEISKLNFNSIILSPGYGNPDNSGVTLDVIDKFYKTRPILGICLGHQCIAKYFGANIIQAKEPCHGKTTNIFFDKNCPIYNSFEQGFQATRYHSLIVDNSSVNLPLKINAKTKDNIIMGLEVENTQTYGVQFHPEAILTTNGINIIENFIKLK